MTPDFTKAVMVATALATPLMVQAEETLVLYTSQPNSDAQQTVDAFEKANPNIDVEWVRDGTTRLITRLRSELSAGLVKPDVLLIADTVTMESLKKDGYLQGYLSPERKNYDSSLYEAEGHYYSTKLITTGIVYNTGAEFQPTSWKDLIRAELNGQVTMPSPLYSGAALVHMATVMENPDLGWSYIEQLKENGAEAQGGNGGVFKAVANGSKPYGVVVDFLPIREAAKGSPVQFVFPEEGASAVTEPVAIMKEASNPTAAQTFVDFLLSEQGQTLVQSQGYLPASDQVAAPAGFPSREAIKLMPFDAGAALEEAEANKARFSELYGG